MKYISDKDEWIMLTNGVNIFNAAHLKKGQEFSSPRKDIFIIKAKTEDELFQKVFRDPHRQEGTTISHEAVEHDEDSLKVLELAGKVIMSENPPKGKTTEIKGGYHISCCAAKLPAEIYAERDKPKPKRARDETGKFAKDDPSTPDYNEAWEGGEAPGEE